MYALVHLHLERVRPGELAVDGLTTIDSVLVIEYGLFRECSVPGYPGPGGFGGGPGFRG